MKVKLRFPPFTNLLVNQKTTFQLFFEFARAVNDLFCVFFVASAAVFRSTCPSLSRSRHRGVSKKTENQKPKPLTLASGLGA